MEALLMLPYPTNGIPPHVLRFLDENLRTQEDLSRVSSLSTELKKDCGDLDRNLTTLNKNLSSLIKEWISRSNSVKSVLHQLNHNFQNFDLYPSQDGKRIIDSKKIQKILGEELPMFVKEMRRIEMVRVYAETTLHLEALVGDLEDAVFSVMNQNTRNIFSINLPKMSSLVDFGWKQEKVLLAVKAMNYIEEVLGSVVKIRSQWCHLLKSVDARVDKSLSVLRLQALADYRALLSSLGWPPPLLTSGPERERSLDLPNPLVLMQGNKKERYSQSFLALCALQHLQARREERQLDLQWDHRLGLWTVDELVSPIASKTEHHFSKWFDQPKFIFALVYKLTRDFVGGVDDVLQPLIDKAMLVGYSVREAWVSAMSKMLSTYLTKRIFCVLAERYNEKNGKSEVIYSWLHLVDLIIAFDKRMQSLASLGTQQFLGESVDVEEFSRGISVLSIFCDRHDWLRIWAKIELKDARKKLKEELENERAWMINNKQGTEFYTEKEIEPYMLSTMEDYKAPFIAGAVVKITRAMIERCQTLPSVLLRAQFLRLSAVRFLWHFFDVLLRSCNEAEFTDGSSEDDDTLIKVCASINAARYCESVLRECSEDVNFLEMRIAEDNSKKARVRNELDDHCCFFWEEIKFLMKLETDWLGEIMADILRQFDILSWEYVQNKEQWGQQQEELGQNYLTVSNELVKALDALRNRLLFFKASLNSKDFLDLWRSVAEGLDHYTFGSIVMSGARFFGHGVDQFLADMQAMFLVFQPFCARPEAFFPCIRDSLKLFEMGLEDVKHLQSVLSKGGKRTEYLRLHGILNVSPDQAEKILRNRKFGVLSKE